MATKLRRFLAVATILLVIAPSAAAVQTEVSLVNLAGSRVMTVQSLSGDSLTSMALGTAGQAAFLINVTDIAYARQGYQVTAQMSDLFRFDPSTSTWACGDVIASAQGIVGFLPSPTSVRGIAAVAAPELDFTGTLSAPITTALGLASGTAVTATVTENLQTFATSTVFSGSESALPITVASGAGGTFTDRMPHAGCSDAGAESPTAVIVQDGSVLNDPAMFAWVQQVSNLVFSTADTNANGVLSPAEGVTASMFSASAVDTSIRNALIALGVNPPLITDSIISSVKALLGANNDVINSILGQSGTYNSLPNLVVSVPAATPSGTYKGTMTITLIDPA